MSATVTPTPTTQAPLISSSPATQATSAAANTAAAAAVTIAIWLIGLAHVTVPPEVSAAFVALVGAGVHWLMLKYGLDIT